MIRSKSFKASLKKKDKFPNIDSLKRNTLLGNCDNTSTIKYLPVNREEIKEAYIKSVNVEAIINEINQMEGPDFTLDRVNKLKCLLDGYNTDSKVEEIIYRSSESFDKKKSKLKELLVSFKQSKQSGDDVVRDTSNPR